MIILRCQSCQKDIEAGLPQCPYCHAPVHYGGHTTFVTQLTQNRLAVKDFFSNVFSMHPAGAGDRMLASGTSLTTPTPDRMFSEWTKPWMYGRFILVAIVFVLLSYAMYVMFDNFMGLIVTFFLGCMICDLGVLIFYWEANIYRDISIYRVFLIFFVGGILSLIFTFALPDIDGPAYLAPLTEEPGKFLAAAIFIYYFDSKHIFSGLLIGAAVGAGFSAFENIQYVLTRSTYVAIAAALEMPELKQLILHNGIVASYIKHDFSGWDTAGIEAYRALKAEIAAYVYDYGIDTLIRRNLHALGGHVTWAAIEGAALVMVKGKEPLQFKHFIDPRFLVYLAIAMVMHALWNSGFVIAEIPLFGTLNSLIMTALAVIVVSTLIKKAVVQAVNDANMAGNAPVSAPSLLTLAATTGTLAGAQFPLNKMLTMGRDSALCDVVFPPKTPGVSRRHCAIESRADGVYVMDLGSSYGTFVNGQRLPDNQWTKLNGELSIGSPNIKFSVTQSQLSSSAAQPVMHPIAANANMQTAAVQPSAQDSPVQPNARPTSSHQVSVKCLAGPLAGRAFSDPQSLTIGRDPQICNVLLPPDTAGVSRQHCKLMCRPDGVYIMDLGSTHGTYAADGHKIAQNQWEKISGSFYLGSQQVVFTVI